MNAPAVRDAAERILRGESAGSTIREWTARGIKPVSAAEWSRGAFTSMLTSPRIAGLLAWQGQKFPTTDWPAIIDVDTHEQLVKLFSNPARRKHVVGNQRHLLSGFGAVPEVRARAEVPQVQHLPGAVGLLRLRARGRRAVRRGGDQGRAAGGVRDRRGPGRAGVPAGPGALRAEDSDAAHREDLLAKIQRAQDIRAYARRDLADGVIDRNDWLDIRQRTEDTISTARREYDRLDGSATVLGDIPPSDGPRGVGIVEHRPAPRGDQGGAA